MTRTITMRLISGANPVVRTPLASSSPRLTIGRDPGADWTLSDPARLLSRLHFEISNDVDGVFAHDHSSNGLFVNSDVEPIGKGQKIALNSGDLLRFGPYVAEILIAEPTTTPPAAQRDGFMNQQDTGRDRVARLAALAAFEPDLAENADGLAVTESTGIAVAAPPDRLEAAAPSQAVATVAPHAVHEAPPDAALGDFARQPRMLIPEDWHDSPTPAPYPSHEQDKSVPNVNANDARISALDALAKLACAVDPDSKGHPYASALHDYTLTGRVAFHEIWGDFNVLNQKVLRLFSEQSPSAPVGRPDPARPTHEH